MLLDGICDGTVEVESILIPPFAEFLCGYCDLVEFLGIDLDLIFGGIWLENSVAVSRIRSIRPSMVVVYPDQYFLCP